MYLIVPHGKDRDNYVACTRTQKEAEIMAEELKVKNGINYDVLYMTNVYTTMTIQEALNEAGVY